jgi:hypothetical protein
VIEGAGSAHNNTTGEMHNNLLQRQQQDDGPIVGGNDIVNNQLFRNSIIYKDLRLQNFIEEQEHKVHEETRQEKLLYLKYK